jgi:hypothetical protein
MAGTRGPSTVVGSGGFTPFIAFPYQDLYACQARRPSALAAATHAKSGFAKLAEEGSLEFGACVHSTHHTPSRLLPASLPPA